MTVDVARLQALLDAAKVAEGLEFGKALWALNNAAADALPALLVVVAERDKLAAQVEAVRAHIRHYQEMDDDETVHLSSDDLLGILGGAR